MNKLKIMMNELMQYPLIQKIISNRLMIAIALGLLLLVFKPHVFFFIIVFSIIAYVANRMYKDM